MKGYSIIRDRASEKYLRFKEHTYTSEDEKRLEEGLQVIVGKSIRDIQSRYPDSSISDVYVYKCFCEYMLSSGKDRDIGLSKLCGIWEHTDFRRIEEVFPFMSIPFPEMSLVRAEMDSSPSRKEDENPFNEIEGRLRSEEMFSREKIGKTLEDIFSPLPREEGSLYLAVDKAGNDDYLRLYAVGENAYYNTLYNKALLEGLAKFSSLIGGEYFPKSTDGMSDDPSCVYINVKKLDTEQVVKTAKQFSSFLQNMQKDNGYDRV